jgi:Rho-binding antiterminator
MTAISSAYHPVSCAFHDRLEDHATLRKPVRIRAYGLDRAVREHTAVITDVYARHGAEYVALDTGDTLRLDQLIEVDGARLADF